MPRWYFNKDTKNCEQFTFGGCLPNENNFFTESECENACEAYIPHQELDDLSDKIQARAAPVEDIENDGCNDEAFVVGRCRAMLNRWSWNPESLACEKFVFGGCDGNGNNFPSKKKCDKKCSYLASQRVMQLDAVESEEEEEEEENEEDPVEKVDPCTEQKDQGRCRARFDRFYFNSKTGDCEAFTYGGCEGNGNNFQTVQLCRQKCLKTNGEMQNDAVDEEEEEAEEDEEENVVPAAGPETDACGLKADAGFCRGYFQSWYFDGEECKTFVYGGCQGNANRFQSKEECENVCKNDEPIFGRNFEFSESNNDDEKPVCEQPIFTGPCRAMYPKFAFDGKNCVPFMYGGCMGNQNNFGSEAQCRQKCMMQNDAGQEEEEEEEEDNSSDSSEQTGQSLIMSREAIREAKKRERQASRKNLGKGKGKGNKNGKNKNGKNKNGKNKNNWINNRSSNRVKGISKDEEDEMRFNFNQNMLTF